MAAAEKRLNTALFTPLLWAFAARSRWWADQKTVALMLAGKRSDEIRRCAAGN
jgi:hypothetical protein